MTKEFPKAVYLEGEKDPVIAHDAEHETKVKREHAERTAAAKPVAEKPAAVKPAAEPDAPDKRR